MSSTKKVSVLRRMPDELVIPGSNQEEKARLSGTGVIEYYCKKCHEIWWMRHNSCSRCPSCGEFMDTGNIEAQWTVPQTAFIPQYETKTTSNGK